MVTPLIDAHAHLDMYWGSMQPVLAEIAANRVVTISVSMDPSSYQRALDRHSSTPADTGGQSGT